MYIYIGLSFITPLLFESVFIDFLLSMNSRIAWPKPIQVILLVLDFYYKYCTIKLILRRILLTYSVKSNAEGFETWKLKFKTMKWEPLHWIANNVGMYRYSFYIFSITVPLPTICKTIDYYRYIGIVALLTCCIR